MQLQNCSVYRVFRQNCTSDGSTATTGKLRLRLGIIILDSQTIYHPPLKLLARIYTALIVQPLLAYFGVGSVQDGRVG